MNKNFCSLFIIAALAGCRCNNSNEVTSTNTSKDTLALVSPEPLTGNLKQYQQFLNKLDTANAETATEAVVEYKRLFEKENEAMRDAAYALFDNYYERLDYGLNARMEQDTLDYMSLITYDAENGKQKPVSKELQAYEDRLERNGFEVWSEEGMPYIRQGRGFVAKHFYGLVSTTMRQYLQQVNKENKEGFSEDAGITILPQQHVDRLAWWDAFIAKNPGFILADKAKQNRRHLLNWLVEGMDNTPLQMTENNQLDEYHQDAYDYLQKAYPNSTSLKIIRPYFNALYAKDQIKADAFLKEFRTKGFILNYGGDQ